MNILYSIFLLLFPFAFLFAQERYSTSIYEGNKAFEQENYSKASSKFLDAIKINEKDFTAHYNLGNALYKDKKYEDAINQYKKAESLAKNQRDKTASLYNLGNAYMKAGNKKQAAEYYKKALKQDPYNEKIRKNYEIAKRKEPEQPENKQKENQEQNQNNPKKDSPKPSPKEPNNSDNQKPNGTNQNEQGKGDDRQQNQGKNPSEQMPKDLQDALLDRIKSREQETTRKILNKNSYSVPQSNEKDW